jgi:Spy/CpxP family protein refolding chaperone
MSRWWALVSVFALFLAGISIGALGMHLIQERSYDGFHPPFFQEHHRPWGRYLASRLDLTWEQREKIADIRRESRRESESLRRELRPRIEKQMEATREKILAVLTPSQREQLEKILREDPRALHRFFLGDEERRPGGPPGAPRAPRPGPPPGAPPPPEPPRD